MELSIIAQEILENALLQLEDADYENHARLFVGDAMILVDKDDFEELKANVLTFSTDHENRIKEREFEDVVTIKTETAQ